MAPSQIEEGAFFLKTIYTEEKEFQKKCRIKPFGYENRASRCWDFSEEYVTILLE